MKWEMLLYRQQYASNLNCRWLTACYCDFQLSYHGNSVFFSALTLFIWWQEVHQKNEKKLCLYTNWLIKTQPNIIFTFDVKGKKMFGCVLINQFV